MHNYLLESRIVDDEINPNYSTNHKRSIQYILQILNITKNSGHPLLAQELPYYKQAENTTRSNRAPLDENSEAKSLVYFCDTGSDCPKIS